MPAILAVTRRYPSKVRESSQMRLIQAVEIVAAHDSLRDFHYYHYYPMYWTIGEYVYTTIDVNIVHVQIVTISHGLMMVPSPAALRRNKSQHETTTGWSWLHKCPNTSILYHEETDHTLRSCELHIVLSRQTYSIWGIWLQPTSCSSNPMGISSGDRRHWTPMLGLELQSLKFCIYLGICAIGWINSHEISI